MPLNTLFSLSNLLVLPFWFVMIFLPRWNWARKLIGSPLIAVPPALLYAGLILPSVGEVFGGLMNPTLTGVAALLGTPFGATVGWAHFLAFDLFVGRWAYLDAHERGLHPLLMVPILFMVLMLGPVGLLLYLIARYAQLVLTRRAPNLARTGP
jgi:hypothetical protein